MPMGRLAMRHVRDLTEDGLGFRFGRSAGGSGDTHDSAADDPPVRGLRTTLRTS